MSANNLHLPEERAASQPSFLRTPIGRLRVIAFSEGCSYLLLLGVAMPLKYFFGMPLAVRLVGSIHGGLFLVFCAALLHVMIATAGCRAREPEQIPGFAIGVVDDGRVVYESS